MTALALQHSRGGVEAQDCFVPIAAPFQLDSGDALDDGGVRISRFGAPCGPQVVMLGGISAGRRVCGADGWWRGVVEAGVDLERFGVIGVDFAPLADRRVRITPHDQARLIALALDALGVRRLHAFVGASYGGMIGLAFAALAPEKLDRLCVISAAHRPSAQALAWRGVQRRIVEYALSHGDGAAGLSLARQLAMITYRSAEELEARFGSGVDAHGQSDLDRYLVARGESYVDAMAPQRWLSLSEAIDRFAVDPAAIAAPTSLVACPGDQLVPFADVQELARRLPRLAALHALPSIFGHDAFLKETPRLAAVLRTFLESPAHD